MNKILVIGATGFIGGHITRALLAKGYAIRALTRNPAHAAPLAAAGCEIYRGDISDPASIDHAVEGVSAIYISVVTLNRQAGAPGQGYMEIELQGLRNILAACQKHGVSRMIYITFLGVRSDSPSEWMRGRWQAEELLLHSGLDVTLIQPGQVIGWGGEGFEMTTRSARQPVAFSLGSGRQKMRHIAIDDLVYYLAGVLEDPRAYGQRFEVGCDDVLTYDQMIDLTADVLGKAHPLKVHISLKLLTALAPLIEKLAKLPAGAGKALAESAGLDLVGDPTPIRALLPRPPLGYRAAVQHALAEKSA